MHFSHLKWFTIAALSIVLVLVMGTTSTASADPITVHFTIFPGSCIDFCGPVVSDPVNTKPSAGTFTFDSSIIPAGGGGVKSIGGPSLASTISFHWSSTLWTEANATAWELFFSKEGDLQSFSMGDRDSPQAVTVDPPSSIVDDFFLVPAIIEYTNRELPGWMHGRVVTEGIPRQPAAAIPEPSSMLLVASGLAMLVARARRKPNAPTSPIG